MFKKARFIFATNKAIAEIGINPQWLNSSVRGPMIEAGFNDGRTPQEVATFIVCQLPAAHQP